MAIKTYSELIRLPSYEERLEYLKINGSVGTETFGFDRWLNQIFYRSKEWKDFRRDIIIRDNGCDLACVGLEIIGEPILIHHMNPITLDDISEKNLDVLLNPENAISTRLYTHNCIHYGTDEIINRNVPIERKPNDTCPWRHRERNSHGK